MSNRKKKRKSASRRSIINEERNMRERGRVRDINFEYDKLVMQLGGVVVKPGLERRRAGAHSKKRSQGKLRKEDILFEAANYIEALMEELKQVKSTSKLFAKDIEMSGCSQLCCSAPSNPPNVTPSTIPESELECDEMFEAIVPPDGDDHIVTTTSSLQTAVLTKAHKDVSEEGAETQTPIQPHYPEMPTIMGAFSLFSPGDSPTPLGPNLQNTAAVTSPEQLPLPSSTVSALPVPDNISPELLHLPLPHCFQHGMIPGLQTTWFSSSPCDSTSLPPISPYFPSAPACSFASAASQPSGDQATVHQGPVTSWT